MQGFKTTAFFAAAAALGALMLFGAVTVPADLIVLLFAQAGVPLPVELAQYLVGRAGGAIALALGLAGIGFRIWTRTPIFTRLPKAIAPLLPLLLALPLLGACGFTPEGDAARAAVAARGAEAYDAGLDNATWFICNAASVGSVNRRFGGDPATYLAFCGAARGAVPPSKIDGAQSAPERVPPRPLE